MPAYIIKDPENKEYKNTLRQAQSQWYEEFDIDLVNIRFKYIALLLNTVNSIYGVINMQYHIFVLLGVMLASGVFGGIINYFFNNRGRSDEITMMKSIIIGTGASLIVPLFLNMISSDLINFSRTDPYKIFVIAGYCLIAAISSTAFIGRISKNVINELDKANKKVRELEGTVELLRVENTEASNEFKRVRGALDPLMARGTEPEYSEEEMLFNGNGIDLQEDEKMVLSALANCQYVYRTIEGLARDTKLDKLMINNLIEKLIMQNLAARSDRPEGARFYITKEGRGVVFQLQRVNE